MAQHPAAAVYPSVVVRGHHVALERSAGETIVVNQATGTYSAYYYSDHGLQHETHGHRVSPALRDEITAVRRHQADREGVGLGG